MSRTIELGEGQIAIIWSVEDVMMHCEWLTEEQALEVLHYLDNKHDANIGVNWETIHYWAEYLFPEENTDE